MSSDQMPFIHSTSRRSSLFNYTPFSTDVIDLIGDFCDNKRLLARVTGLLPNLVKIVVNYDETNYNIKRDSIGIFEPRFRKSVLT